MTADTVATAQRKPRRHARRRFPKVKDFVSIRIPKAANRVMDWVHDDPKAAGAVAAATLGFCVLVGLSPLAIPVLSAIGGAVAGGCFAGVCARIASAEQRRTIRKLHAENEGLRLTAVTPEAPADGETLQIFSIRDLP